MEETGEDGFDQAIKLSAEYLSNMKFTQEHNLLGKYFEETDEIVEKHFDKEQKNNEQLSSSCQPRRSRGSGGDVTVLVAILSLSPTNHTRSRSYVEVLGASEGFSDTSMI
ncbi:hypothetical protein ACFX13_039176 [Malus domestica]